MSLNLTLSMIVKNEEKYLRDCLESVKNVVDEIVLVDTGSTDNTIAIAREYGAKIFHFKWINDFSAARNFALSKSKGEWILYLDADERLSQDSLEELKKIVATREKAAYYCYVKSVDDTRGTPSVMKYPRLFRNSKKIKFEGKVHEQIINSLLANKYVLKDSSIEIIHLGYNIPKEELDKKAQRNLILLFEEYKKNKTSYLAFQIAQSYGIQNDKINAVKFYKEMLAIEDECPSAYKAHAYRYLAAYELDYGDIETAYYYYKQGLLYDSTQALLRYVGSQIYYKKQMYEEAYEESLNAIEFNEKLLTGKKLKEFDFFINPEDFILIGLRSALKLKDKTKFQSTLEKLKQYGKEDLYRLIKSFYSEEKINEEEALKAQKSNNLMELLLETTENCQKLDIKVYFYELIAKMFGMNSKIAASYGMFAYENQLYDKAELYLNLAMNLGSNHPTIRFYLIGLYASKNDLEAVKKIIEKSEKDFAFDSLVLEKLKKIKEKII